MSKSWQAANEGVRIFESKPTIKRDKRRIMPDSEHNAYGHTWKREDRCCTRTIRKETFIIRYCMCAGTESLVVAELATPIFQDRILNKFHRDVITSFRK